MEVRRQMRIRTRNLDDGSWQSIVEARIDGKICRREVRADTVEELKEKRARLVEVMDGGVCPELATVEPE